MVGTIMDSLWDRDFMASHSLTGKRSPTEKDTTKPTKPALPEDDAQALISTI